MALVLSLTPFGLCAAPVQRTLELRLIVDATQDWRNNQQWGKTKSQQLYSLASELRSDGRLYQQNLLDPDPPRRMQIKMDWYLYQGLSELKAENGEKLPPGGTQRAEISAETLKASGGLVPLLAQMSPQRMAALQALSERTPADLEAFMRKIEQPGGRWMYFEGFEGCSNRLRLTYHSHFSNRPLCTVWRSMSWA